jgi:hypothetical protein
MNVGRSMGNVRPLAEFNQSGWIQVDFAPLINYRRKEGHRHVTKRVEDIFDQEMSSETTRISANGNPTLSTSVVVPGGLPRAIPVSAMP